MTLDRRQFLGRSALGLLAFQVGGTAVLLTPAAARAQAVPFRVLTADEVTLVEALAETLLPGAAEAGLAHFLDQQLAADPQGSLLMIRYLDVPPPYIGFYRAGFDALAGAARAAYGKAFAELEPAVRHEFVGQLQRETPTGWRGPPAPFFYFVLRSDAVDVVYGTPEGFARLGVPYMQHIMPPTPW